MLGNFLAVTERTCRAHCPFCGRVCDADMEAEHYHTVCTCGEVCEIEYIDSIGDRADELEMLID